MHEANHVADAVVSGHELFSRAVIVKERDAVFTIHVELDRIGIVWEARSPHFVGITLSGDFFNETGDEVAVFVSPGIPDAFPVAVKVSLDDFHLLTNRIFSIVLHAGVKRGNDFQAIGIDVQVRTFLTNFIANGIAEVESLAIVGAFHVEVQADGLVKEFFQRRFVADADLREMFRQQIAMLIHVVQDDISPLEGVLGIDFGIIGGRRLQESDKNSCLLGFQIGRGRVEVGLRGSFDAESVRPKIDGVGIHLQNFFLLTKHLKLGSNNHLLALHDENADTGNLSKKSGGVLCANAEHVLHQLLRDGGGAARLAVRCVLDSGKNALHVNAVVLVEAFVFCRNQGLEEYGRDGVVGYRRAILVEEFAQHFPVSTVDFRSCRCFGMNDVLNGRRLPEKPKKVEDDGESVEHPKSDE